MPIRLRRDWSKAKIGQCDCGYHGSIADGKCADCHDVEYQQERERVLIDRIIELQSQDNSLTKREIFAKDAPDMPEWWPRFYRYNIIDPEDTSILNGGESKFGDMNYKGYLSAIASWRWHYADMMMEVE